MPVSYVSNHRIGPMSREDANYIVELQLKGRWGYVPQVTKLGTGDFSYFVTMYGERDAKDAIKLLPSHTREIGK